MVPIRFSRIRYLPHLRAGIWISKAKSGRDSWLKECMGRPYAENGRFYTRGRIIRPVFILQSHYIRLDELQNVCPSSRSSKRIMRPLYKNGQSPSELPDWAKIFFRRTGLMSPIGNPWKLGRRRHASKHDTYDGDLTTQYILFCVFLYITSVSQF